MPSDESLATYQTSQHILYGVGRRHRPFFCSGKVVPSQARTVGCFGYRNRATHSLVFSQAKARKTTTGDLGEAGLMAVPSQVDHMFSGCLWFSSVFILFFTCYYRMNILESMVSHDRFLWLVLGQLTVASTRRSKKTHVKILFFKTNFETKTDHFEAKINHFDSKIDNLQAIIGMICIVFSLYRMFLRLSNSFAIGDPKLVPSLVQGCSSRPQSSCVGFFNWLKTSVGPNTFQGSHCSFWVWGGSLRVCLAMDDPFLEPDWGTILDGSVIDLMTHVVVWGGPDHGAKHLCKTAIRNKFVVVLGKLSQHPSHSILGGVLSEGSSGIRINVDSAVVLPHGTHGPSDFCNVIEGCAGIGCLGSGLESCGFSLLAGNDLSPPMCNFLEAQGRCNIVPGDIGSAAVLQSLHCVNKPPACLAGGFSCQPWSALGDKRKCLDPRATSLKHLLRAGYHLRVHSIMLECVTGAADDVQVRRMIDRFCVDAGFRKVDVCLHLQDIMPAKRDRWWCLLTCPAIQVPAISGLPKLPTAPVVGDLLPYNIAWPIEQQEQLLLDRYETGKFECYGGLCNQLVRPGECLKTALHGWGNQLHGCPCLCREHALSESRLKERGLFGALFMVGGEFQTSQWVLPKTRHVHPIELALLHGVSLDWEWGPNLKFSLCGLGQLASPVQSCWVGGHLMKGVDQLLDRPWTSPAVHLANHFVHFFASVKKVLPMVAANDKFYAYTRDVWALLRAHAQDDAGIPLPVLPPTDPVVDEKNNGNSQRAGRKNLEVPQDEDKQPATRSPEPEKRNKQPAWRRHQDSTRVSQCPPQSMFMPCHLGPRYPVAPPGLNPWWSQACWIPPLQMCRCPQQ